MSTVHERVWQWMRKQTKPVKVEDIRAALKLHKSTASQAVCRLVVKGCAVRSGNGRYTFYTATKVRPEDMRGTAEGTLRVLAVNHAKRLPPRVKRVRLPMLERLWLARNEVT